MKRAGIVLVILWLLTIQTLSAQKQMGYEIIFASNSTNLWEVKNELVATFNDVVGSVDEAYYSELIISGLDAFEHIKDSKVTYQNMEIRVVIGDGKGIKIAGNFNPTCKVEIKKKSILKELFLK